MNVTLNPCAADGTVAAVASKSSAQRLLICAALSPGITEVVCRTDSHDISACIRCLEALGSSIQRRGDTLFVSKLTAKQGDSAVLCCDESATVLRLMLCVCAGLGVSARLTGTSGLFLRPLTPLVDVLKDAGCFVEIHKTYADISGAARPGEYAVDGSISSQYISGILFMSAILCNGTVTVNGSLQSRPYVDLTVDSLRLSGVQVSVSGGTYTVQADKGFSLSRVRVPGDWSNSSFFLAMGALSGRVAVSGLDYPSLQGDSRIVDILRAFGARMTVTDGDVVCEKGLLCAIDIDVSDIPDAVPVIAALASAAGGTTHITGAHRLNYKESNRLESVTQMINSVGGRAEHTTDSITVTGGRLLGGTVDAHNDHRIAMAAAVLSCRCDAPVTILGAQAVNKSYPGFFDDIGKVLPGQVSEG